MIQLSYETKRGLCAMARSGYQDLTRCETQVLQLFLQGMASRDIADALQASYSSVVSKHLPNIRKKFQVKNDVDLVLASVWLGFCEPGLKKLAGDVSRRAA
ncbi:MAG: helix-turn-helix transcriptional regulator [Bryobacteraceae bacterium]